MKAPITGQAAWPWQRVWYSIPFSQKPLELASYLSSFHSQALERSGSSPETHSSSVAEQDGSSCFKVLPFHLLILAVQAVYPDRTVELSSEAIA